MPAPNSSYSEMLSTTIDNYRDTLADNVMENNVLLKYLKDSSMSDPCSGGVKMLENLKYAENGTLIWYSGYEQLVVDASDALTTAAFDWKQLNCNVTMSGLEEMQNNGPEAMHNLIKARIQVAEATMQNGISEALFYSNTENGGKSIGGLQHLIADLPSSGTVGGIDRGTNTWWRNQFYDFSGETVTASASTIQHAMNLMYLRTERGTEKVKVIVAGESYFSFYEESLQAQQRFIQDGGRKATGGFTGYAYKDAIVFYDPHCNTSRMYGLNPKYIHFRPHKNRNFVILKDKVSVNQDATVTPLYWGGNLTLSNAARHFVICA
jgi:hypothetical protein